VSPRPLLALVACETSGEIRGRLRAAGHHAFSVDLLPAEDGSPYHFTEDALRVIAGHPWDLLIAHPPCRYLAGSGMHWTTRGLRDPKLTDEAVAFALAIWNSGVPKIVLENPVGILTARIGVRPQIVQPYEFGDDASKRTCLWTRGLPPLAKDPTKRFPGRLVKWNGETVERWGNQTDSGQNNLPPSADRWRKRSRTYPGIAQAIVDQWAGNPLAHFLED
jgi:hypothetical protein